MYSSSELTVSQLNVLLAQLVSQSRVNTASEAYADNSYTTCEMFYWTQPMH